MKSNSQDAKTQFDNALEVVLGESGQSAKSSRHWRLMLTNDPAFDKAAEDEVWTMERFLAAHRIHNLLSRKVGESNDARTARHEEIVRIASSVYENAAMLIQNAIEEIEKLPQDGETMGIRKRALTEIGATATDLRNVKESFNTIIGYARHHEVQAEIVLRAINSFEYFCDTSAYDALERRNQTLSFVTLSKKRKVSDAEIDKYKRDNDALKKRLSPNYPPPNTAGEWTPKDIAGWTGLSEEIVRQHARELVKKPTQDAKKNFRPGKRGERKTWNEWQMIRLVDYLRNKTHQGKRGQLK